MNVMLTSVGRRSYMVKYFKKAIGNNGKVYVCNSDPLSPAFSYADKSVLSPLIYSDEYIPFLVDYCKMHNISVVLSLFDIDQLVLAQNKSLFNDNGILVIVSNENFVAICNDKLKCMLYLSENGFCVPATYTRIEVLEKDIKDGKLAFPIVVKPRFGCGSIGIYYANDHDELVMTKRFCKRKIHDTYLKYESAHVLDDVIFQEVIQGQEYGIDVMNDLTGSNRAIVIKEKLAMRAGETDVCRISHNQEVYNTMKKLASLSKHIGNLDCDVIFCKGSTYVLDLNSRFGGGYPFSYEAGYDLPKALIKWCEGKDISPEELKEIATERENVFCKELVINKLACYL